MTNLRTILQQLNYQLCQKNKHFKKKKDSHRRAAVALRFGPHTPTSSSHPWTRGSPSWTIYRPGGCRHMPPLWACTAGRRWWGANCRDTQKAGKTPRVKTENIPFSSNKTHFLTSILPPKARGSNIKNVSHLKNNHVIIDKLFTNTKIEKNWIILTNIALLMSKNDWSILFWNIIPLKTFNFILKEQNHQWIKVWK